MTSEQRDERNATLMVDSQHEATAAALNELGYDTGAEVVVVEAVADSPADGILEADDVITAIDGTPVSSATQLREAIQAAAGAPVQLTVLRDGAEQTVEVTPEKRTEGDATAWLIGITLRTDYDFEIDVTIQLDNVGGPSAGMMFALGIIDTLTEGELNGGKDIAGTGTIDAAGTVGPIGGIRQKLYGARDAGPTTSWLPRRTATRSSDTCRTDWRSSARRRSRSRSPPSRSSRTTATSQRSRPVTSQAAERRRHRDRAVIGMTACAQ